MLPRTQSEQFGARDTHSLVGVTRTLEEAREILRGFEETALAGVAAQLSAAAESLAETAEVLHRIRPSQWVDREGIRAHLAGRTEDQFEKIASEVPKHYLSERVAIYNVLEVDEWVMGR
jgi:hypothetical protein